MGNKSGRNKKEEPTNKENHNTPYGMLFSNGLLHNHALQTIGDVLTDPEAK